MSFFNDIPVEPQHVDELAIAFFESLGLDVSFFDGLLGGLLCNMAR